MVKRLWLQISEHLFSRTPLSGCFCTYEVLSIVRDWTDLSFGNYILYQQNMSEKATCNVV